MQYNIISQLAHVVILFPNITCWHCVCPCKFTFLCSHITSNMKPNGTKDCPVFKPQLYISKKFISFWDSLSKHEPCYNHVFYFTSYISSEDFICKQKSVSDKHKFIKEFSDVVKVSAAKKIQHWGFLLQKMETYMSFCKCPIYLNYGFSISRMPAMSN